MQLDNLEGSGVLVIAGEDAGPVDYDIDVSWDGQFVVGNGALDGDRSLLVQALNANDVKLRLPAGEVKILVGRLGGEGCFFQTSGIIPGVDTGDL